MQKYICTYKWEMCGLNNARNAKGKTDKVQIVQHNIKTNKYTKRNNSMNLAKIG